MSATIDLGARTVGKGTTLVIDPSASYLFATAWCDPFLYQVDLAQNRLVRKARVAPTDDGY